MDTALAAGPAVALAVSLLKRIPWVGRHPKLVAGILSIGATALLSWLHTPVTEPVAAILTTTAAAVLTNETAKHAKLPESPDPWEVSE